MIAHVTRAEQRLAKGRRNVFAAARAAEGARVRRRGRAHHPWRLRGEARQPRCRAEALRARLPHRPGDPELRRRRRSRRHQPARRGDARPHHSHQEQAAGGAGAGCRQAGRLQGCVRARGRPIHRRVRCHVRARERPGRRRQDQARPDAAPGAGAGRRPVRASALRRRMPPSPPTSPRPPSRSSPMPRRSAASRRCPRATCSTSNTGSLEQAKLKGAVAKPFAGQVAVVTGAGSGIGEATAKAFAAEGAAVAVLDLDEAAAKAAAKEVGGLGARLRRDRRKSVRAAFARIAEEFGGVDIVVSNAGAAWQGRIGEVSDEQSCARASSSTSSPIRRWRRRRCASCASRGRAAACCSTCPSRRSIPAPTSGPTACPRRRRWP